MRSIQITFMQFQNTFINQCVTSLILEINITIYSVYLSITIIICSFYLSITKHLRLPEHVAYRGLCYRTHCRPNLRSYDRKHVSVLEYCYGKMEFTEECISRQVSNVKNHNVESHNVEIVRSKVITSKILTSKWS